MLQTRYQFGNAQHIGAREQQQDAFGFSNPFDEPFTAHAGLLAVIADGMGGASHGDAAGQAAVRAFLAAYRAKTEDESVPDALLRSVHAAQESVRQVRASFGGVDLCGTTLAAAALRDDQLYWIGAGDSAVWLVRGGEWILLNEFHHYGRQLDLAVRNGTLDADTAAADPQREALTSYLGIDTEPEVDRNIRPLIVSPGEWVVLASDGLYKSVDVSSISITQDSSLQQRCDSLVSAVLARRWDQQDNVTVLSIGAELPAALPAIHGAIPADRKVEPAAAHGRIGARRNAMVAVGALILLLVASVFLWRKSCCAAAVTKPSPVIHQKQNPNPPVHEDPPPPDPRARKAP